MIEVEVKNGPVRVMTDGAKLSRELKRYVADRTAAKEVAVALFGPEVGVQPETVLGVARFWPNGVEEHAYREAMAACVDLMRQLFGEGVKPETVFEFAALAIPGDDEEDLEEWKLPSEEWQLRWQSIANDLAATAECIRQLFGKGGMAWADLPLEIRKPELFFDVFADLFGGEME